MVHLTGLHLLLTYQCNYECDHCFVWGGPSQQGVMTLAQVNEIYRQARELGTIEWIYLEGGEPFLYYPLMVRAAQEAVAQGWRVGVLSNVYWATTVEDALEWLRPLRGLLSDLTVSTDLFHHDRVMGRLATHALTAAAQLELSVGTIVCEVPEGAAGYPAQPPGQPVESGAIMFKGRAAVKLIDGVARRHWREFFECPHETLAAPERVHVDPLGNLHLCQGLLMGNLFRQPLHEMVAAYDPKTHPIVGPLLEGGPAALVEQYGLPHENTYVDACHLCYTARDQLRRQLPQWLGPGAMYGDV